MSEDTVEYWKERAERERADCLNESIRLAKEYAAAIRRAQAAEQQVERLRVVVKCAEVVSRLDAQRFAELGRSHEALTDLNNSARAALASTKDQ